MRTSWGALFDANKFGTLIAVTALNELFREIYGSMMHNKGIDLEVWYRDMDSRRLGVSLNGFLYHE